MESVTSRMSSGQSNYGKLGAVGSSEKCGHGCETVIKVAGTPKNRGKAFYRCPFWKDSSMDCGYFKWAQEHPTNGGDGDMVTELRKLNGGFTDCNVELSKIRVELLSLNRKIAMVDFRVSLVLGSIVAIIVFLGLVFVSRV
ncbi:hypothetical protein LINGRAHAP2_LOCUS30173 [Linum grandiflorum]